jgi:tetratricopeptide (TPR) repeat protein
MKRIKAQKNSTTFNLESWLFILPGLLTLLLYFPVHQFEFTNWDDQVYVTGNTMIQGLTGENLKRIFSEYLMGNYHPLVLLSYAIEYEISGGLNAGFFHMTNVLLHIGGGSILMLCLTQLGFSRFISAILSFIFLIHPFHVESVAWVTERKDVLYGIFWIGAWYAWLRSQSFDSWYGVSLLLFVFSCLSKGMAVTLPIALVAGDWIRHQNLRHIQWKKLIPFFVLAISFGILAIYAQKSGGNVREDNHYTLLEQFQVAGWGIWFYLSRTLLPLDLSLFYEYPNLEKSGMPLSFTLATAGSICLIGIGIYLIIKNYITPALGILFFLGVLFPVSQIFPVGNAIAADRYHYIPSIGLLLILGYIFTRYENTKVLKGILTIWIIALAWMSRERIMTWKNPETLWGASIERNPEIMFAYKNLAKYLETKGKAQEAEAVYRKALQQDSTYATGWNELGVLLKNRGLNDEAYPYFVKSVALDSINKEAWLNIGTWHDRRGEMEVARKAYLKSIAIDSNYAEAWNNYANSMSRTRAYDSADYFFNKAIQIYPGYAEAYNNRGTNFALQGKLDSARIIFLKALEIQPGYGEPAYNLAHVYLQLNQKEEGINWMRKAAQSGHEGARQLLRANGIE